MASVVRRVIAAIVAAFAVVICCVSASAASDTLRLGEAEANWTALDPQVGTFWGDAWSLLHASCTTLVTSPAVSGPRDEALVPDGATGFPRVSRDGKTYTFTVRRNLRFSDGTHVTAANYARAIGRLVDPALNSEMVFYAHGIKAVHGRGQTLVITLKEPAGDLLDRLALPMFCPVPVAFPVDPAGITLTVGSGPYRVASVVPERSATLVRNPYYLGSRQARFDRITFTIGGTPESLEADVAAGRLDYSFDGVPPDLIPSAASKYRPGKSLFYKPFPGLFYLPLNLKSPLFENNLPLRRAVEYAVDRAEIVRQLAPYSGRRLGQLIPPGVAGHGEDVYPLSGAKLALARRLAKGHLRSGKLTFDTFASVNFVRVAAIIAYNLRQIGLQVTVQSFGDGKFEQQKLLDPNEKWDIGTGEWFADFPASSDFVLPIVGPGKSAAIPDAAFVRRERHASGLTGSARDIAFASLAHDAVDKYAAVVPLYSVTHVALVSPRLSCVSFNTMTDLNVSNVCLHG